MTKKKSATVELGGSPVRKTNRFFMQLKGYGMADDKGKTVFGIGMGGGKQLAQPDAPLALIVVLLEEIIPAMQYSTPEAALKDLKRFTEFVNDLQLKG